MLTRTTTQFSLADVLENVFDLIAFVILTTFGVMAIPFEPKTML